MKVTKELELLKAAGFSTKAAESTLARLGSLPAIATASLAELTNAGVPEKTASKLLAAFTIGRAGKSTPERKVISVPSDVWDLVRDRVTTHPAQEVFYVIPLNIRNEALDVIEVARGTVCGVEVHPREVFRPAIRLAAAGVIVVHNHPSGDPTPSTEDVELTRRLREAGSTLGIPVVDHVVVTPERFRSIAEWISM